MATVIKRDGSNGKPGKYYTAFFRDAAGKLVSRSTKTSDRKLADRIANEWEASAKAPKTADHVARVNSILAGDILASSGPTKVLTVREYVKRYLKERRVELTEGGLTGIRGKLDAFLNFLEKEGRDEAAIGALTRNDIINFRDHEEDRVSVATANIGLTYVKGLFKHASENGARFDNPARGVKKIRENISGDDADGEAARRAFTMDELRAILKAADGFMFDVEDRAKVARGEWKTMVLLGLWTGHRLGDLARLKWSAVNLETRTIVIRPRKTRGKKNNKPVHLPIMEELYDHLLALRTARKPSPEDALSPRMFAEVSRAKGGSASKLSFEFVVLLTSAGVRESVRADRSGIKGDRHVMSEVSFHSLRHTTASVLVNANVSLYAIGEILGHGSEAMTARYAHADMARAREAMLKIPRIITPPANVIPMKDEKILRAA